MVRLTDVLIHHIHPKQRHSFGKQKQVLIIDWFIVFGYQLEIGIKIDA